MLSLVIMAAGAGSRFGGSKQTTPVGPRGQCLFEYSIYDALLAGFDHIVMVVNSTTDQNYMLQRIRRINTTVPVNFVVQANDNDLRDIPASMLSRREKLWGTVHAVLSTRQYITGDFSVINADDFYGASAFSTVANSLKQHQGEITFAALPGYLLEKTLSEYGGVNRAVCQIDIDGNLISIHEIHDLKYTRDHHIVGQHDNQPTEYALNTTVSLNFWGFSAGVYDCLTIALLQFINDHLDEKTTELNLSTAINQAITNNQIQVRVLPVDAEWFGLTYQLDVSRVSNAIRKLTQADLYPKDWCDANHN